MTDGWVHGRASSADDAQLSVLFVALGVIRRRAGLAAASLAVASAISAFLIGTLLPVRLAEEANLLLLLAGLGVVFLILAGGRRRARVELSFPALAPVCEKYYPKL